MGVTIEISLEGRVAFVSGASKGIGIAVAKSLAAAGADLVLTARDEAGLEATAEAARASGVQVWTHTAKLADADDVKWLGEAVLADCGRVDILVNNAGITRPEPLFEVTLSFFAARYGIALSTGGFLAKPRDMARFGLLFTPSYKIVTDEKIISDRYLDIILNGGRPELLRNGRNPGPANETIKHNVYQWDRVFKNNDVYKGGWAGQGLMFNPDRDLVVVYVGYMKDDTASEMSVLTPLRKILDELYGAVNSD